MLKVLVLDSAQRSALAITRSLGQKKVTVITADSCANTIAQSSKYSLSHERYSDPRQEASAFLRDISRIVKEQDIDLLYPTTDITTSLILGHTHLFPEGSCAILPNFEQQQLLSDKFQLLQLANSLDLPTPSSHYVDLSKSRPLPTIEQWPVVLKPIRSYCYLNGVSHTTAVKIAYSQNDLNKLLAQHDWFKNIPFMIQEFIGGEGQGVFALYNKGKAVSFFAHRRLREKPPWGGVSVLCESTETNPRMQQYAQALLDKAKWHGVAMVEFKVTADGTPYLMEINTRFWGSLQLAIDSGLDFPYLLYQCALGESPPEPAPYKRAQKLRWLLGDLDSLYIYLISKDRYSKKQKILRILQFLKPLIRNTRQELFRWHDPKPAITELKNYISALKK